METEGKITIYTSSLCPVCALVREFFAMQELAFDEINLDLRPIERLKLVATSKQLRTPQTNINGQWVGGFQPEQFFKLMN